MPIIRPNYNLYMYRTRLNEGMKCQCVHGTVINIVVNLPQQHGYPDIVVGQIGL